MLLTYDYKGQSHKVFIHWTADTGNSTVFQEIVQRISDKHPFNPGCYPELAEYLDGLTDKLYKQLYAFTDEHNGVPYNPRFRQAILRVLSDVADGVKECPMPDSVEGDNPLSALFDGIADKLREIVNIYLDDSAYQCKYRERMRDKEQYIETTPTKLMSFEFENILLQMIDLSSVMDCLTDLQRHRLVKHVFLKYTLQEIADNEHVSVPTVRESVVTALNKIKQLLA